MFMVEQGSSRYIVRPEYSTLVGGRSERQDAPVTFWVRTTKEIIGKAQIRVFNTLRGQNGGMSEPASIEILDEPLPPELFGVT